MSKVNFWGVALLLGVATAGLAGGGVMPFKLGGTASPTRTGGQPQAASFQLDANAAMVARSEALNAASSSARCRQAGLSFYAETGRLTIGNETLTINGVCADLNSGAREIYAASSSRRMAIIGVLSGPEGRKTLTARVLENQGSGETATFQLVLMERN